MLLIIVAMGLCPIALATAKTTATAINVLQNNSSQPASPRETRFLLSPTLVAESSEATFVFDAEIGSIKAIQNGEIVLCSSQENTPVAIDFVENCLFVLSSSNLEAFAYSPKTEFDDAALTPVEIETDAYTFPTTMSCFSFVVEQTNELSLFVQLSNGSNIEIKKHTLTYIEAENKFLLSAGATFNSPTLADQTSNTEGKITTFAAQKTEGGYKIVCSDQTATYGLVCSSSSLQSCQQISSQKSASICIHDGKFACALPGSVMFFDQSFNEVENSAIEFSATSLASHGDNLVALSESQAIAKRLLPSQQVLFENEEITPSINTNNLQFGATTKDLILFEKPYSVSGIAVSEGQNVIILSENGNGYEGFCYVSFATNNQQNNYGFLPIESIQKMQVVQNHYAAKARTSTNLLLLPSTVADQTNQVVATLQKNEQITVLSHAADIENNGQTKFVQVQTQGGLIGYVELSNITPVASTSRLKQINANATAKRDTILLSSKKEGTPLLSVAEGTRIKIFGLLNPTTDYTRVEIEDQNGNVISGYIKTADIKSDSITTLQLTGIVLLAANAALLGAIIAFAIVAKKKKVIE